MLQTRKPHHPSPTPLPFLFAHPLSLIPLEIRAHRRSRPIPQGRIPQRRRLRNRLWNVPRRLREAAQMEAHQRKEARRALLTFNFLLSTSPSSPHQSSISFLDSSTPPTTPIFGHPTHHLHHHHRTRHRTHGLIDTK